MNADNQNLAQGENQAELDLEAEQMAKEGAFEDVVADSTKEKDENVY